MKIIKVNSKNVSKKIIGEVIRVLKSGGAIVYPTETSYGLGADASNKKAVEKVFKIKKRALGKSVIVIVSNLRMAEEYAKFNKQALELAKKYWPGPLTLVLPMKKRGKRICANLSGRSFNIGIRVSSCPIALKLVKELGRPLISTSANISGKKPSYSVKEVVKQFKNQKNQPDLILDAGQLRKVKPSTVVEVRGREVKILRKGPLRRITN